MRLLPIDQGAQRRIGEGSVVAREGDVVGQEDIRVTEAGLEIL
jgi:hypothetical protein